MAPRAFAALLLVATFTGPVNRPSGGRTSRATGAIEGSLALHLRPPLRLTGHYPGAALTPHSVQALPAVVYLKGRVDGAAPVPAAIDPVMEQHDTAFAPAALVVTAGTTVVFPNGDPFFHNVFSYSQTKRFDLGRYPRGTSKRVTFDEPGVVKLYCEVHNFMRGLIVVTENPFHAVVSGDGSFRIEGVPPGTYTLVLMQPDLGQTEQQVTVTAGGVARVRAELG